MADTFVAYCDTKTFDNVYDNDYGHDNLHERERDHEG